jgi:hypothetical protein
VKIFEYYSRYESARGSFRRLPGWARLILMVFALPGIVALGLSLLAAGVSILALLLLTLPVLRVLNWVTGTPATVPEDEEELDGFEVDITGLTDAGSPKAPLVEPERPRRQIDVRIIE